MEARYADQDRGIVDFGGKILVGLLVGFLLLAGRLVQINTSDGPRLLTRVDAQQTASWRDLWA